MLSEENHDLLLKLAQEKEQKEKTQIDLHNTNIYQSDLSHKHHSMMNEISDLNGEYNKALIELQSIQTEKIDLEIQLKKYIKRINMLEEQNKKNQNLILEKDQQIKLVERDHRYLQQNFMLLKDKNSNLNQKFQQNWSQVSKDSHQRNDTIQNSMNENKDLSREIENKIQSVKKFMGTSY